MTIIATSGLEYYPLLHGAPPNLVGTLTLALELPDNTVIDPPSTSNIVGTSPGSYTGTRVAPVIQDTTTYVVVWFDGVTSVTEDLIVSPMGLVSEGLYYASPDNLRTYLGLSEVQFPDDEAIPVLRLTQRDIDYAIGSWEIQPDTTLKLASVSGKQLITDLQARLLIEATCAQAEFRMSLGPEFMIEDQFASQVDVRYSVTVKVRKLSSKSYAELSAAGLIRLHGKASNYDGFYGTDRLPTA